MNICTSVNDADIEILTSLSKGVIIDDDLHSCIVVGCKRKSLTLDNVLALFNIIGPLPFQDSDEHATFVEKYGYVYAQEEGVIINNTLYPKYQSQLNEYAPITLDEANLVPNFYNNDWVTKELSVLTDYITTEMKLGRVAGLELTTHVTKGDREKYSQYLKSVLSQTEYDSLYHNWDIITNSYATLYATIMIVERLADSRGLKTTYLCDDGTCLVDNVVVTTRGMKLQPTEGEQTSQTQNKYEYEFTLFLTHLDKVKRLKIKEERKRVFKTTAISVSLGLCLLFIVTNII